MLLSMALVRNGHADVTITAPESRAVFQRDAQGGALVEVRCIVEAIVLEALEVRAVPMDESSGTATDWELVSTATSGLEYVHALRLDGGWYRIEARTSEGEGLTSEAAVEKVGVGEVFITAGQSNSANSGLPQLAPEEDRVSAWGPDGWQHAQDPQPIATGGGGTPWPVLGDLLVREYRVPVGFISVGWGGTSVREWLPHLALYPRLRDALDVVQQHGLRAILWHQGESDNNGGTRFEDYVTRLQTVIGESRSDAGFDVPWGIALVSFAGAVADRIIDAQNAVIASDPLVFEGPATDPLVGPEWRHDGIHFNEPGLREHARLWWETIEDYFDLSERPRPAITVSSFFVGDGEEFTVTADGSVAEDGRTLVDWEWDFGDGTTATGLSVTHTFTGTGPRRIVLAITDSDGHRQTTTAEVFVTLGSESVAPWSTASVGTSGFSGGERFADGCLEMAGGGSGIRGISDEFRYVYQELAGDFALTARLADRMEFGRSDVGLLLRESLEEGPKQFGIFRSESNTEPVIFARVRSTFLSRARGTVVGSTATWLRLERWGPELIALSSEDAATWHEHWREDLDLGETVFAGLAVTSDASARDFMPLPTFATFCGVSVEELKFTFLRGDCNGDGQVIGTVTDAAFLLNFLFLGRQKPSCLAACDADGNGEVVATVADAFYLLNYTFSFGPPPMPPFPECGEGGEADRELGCAESHCP